MRRPDMRVAPRAEALVVVIVADDEDDIGAALRRAGKTVAGRPREWLSAGEIHGLSI